MEERTMRWPGHVEQMRLPRDMGLFDEEKRMLGYREALIKSLAGIKRVGSLPDKYSD